MPVQSFNLVVDFDGHCNGIDFDDDAWAEAKTAMIGGGCELIVPGRSKVEFPINLDGLKNTIIRGYGPTMHSGGNGSMIDYVGSAGNAVSLRNAYGVTLKDMTIAYENPAFTGYLTDWSCDVDNLHMSVMDNVSFLRLGSIPTVNGVPQYSASGCEYLHKTVKVQRRGVLYQHAGYGAVGGSGGGGDCACAEWRGCVSIALQYMFVRLGGNCLIDHHTFEPSPDGTHLGVPVGGKPAGIYQPSGHITRDLTLIAPNCTDPNEGGVWYEIGGDVHGFRVYGGSTTGEGELYIIGYRFGGEVGDGIEIHHKFEGVTVPVDFAHAEGEYTAILSGIRRQDSGGISGLARLTPDSIVGANSPPIVWPLP